MANDGKPKPFNLPGASSTPPESSRPKPLGIPDATSTPASDAAPSPRKLNISDRAPPPSPVSAPSPVPRPLNIPERQAPAPVPSPAPVAAPGRLHISDRPAPTAPMPAPSPARFVGQPLPSQNPLIDQLIAKAQQIEASIRPERIKGRIDTILASSITELLDFGNRNLTPLQNTSAHQARISSELTRIDATGWIERTKDASCKPPSFMDRLTGGGKPPSYYEGMLQKTRAELLTFVGELEQTKKSFFREITDLHLDAVAMIVCSETFDDDHAKMTAHNRGRTLLQAHQTAAVVQTTVEQSMLICAQNIQQIDTLLSVTLPQWKAAFGTRP